MGRIGKLLAFRSVITYIDPTHMSASNVVIYDTSWLRSEIRIVMIVRPLQITLASLAIVLSAVVAYALTPREMMARASNSFDLAKIIPHQFGEWTVVPNVTFVEPEPEGLARELYSQEVGLGFMDHDHHLVMLLIAYGPDQSARLQVHRPERCYASIGFHVSPTFRAEVTYREGVAPLPLLRLTAQRETRHEPISYWTRIGDDVPVGVIERNLVRLRLALQGKIADGALIRVSTLGLPDETAFQIHDRFIHDLLEAIAPEDRDFFVGDRTQLVQSSAKL
jgi:EpsI family protein